jgi:uncharacterized membrane protein HdeD (DUF308 family)
MDQKAKPVKKSESSKSGGRKISETLGFGKVNYYLMVLGLVFIVIGYIALASGSITLAPIMLVLGYCVILPVAILIKDRWSNKSASEVSSSN